jgi:hypothetical protein
MIISGVRSKNRNNIEYQLPRNFVQYSKKLSYLTSLSYYSNITPFLNLVVVIPIIIKAGCYTIINPNKSIIFLGIQCLL